MVLYIIIGAVLALLVLIGLIVGLCRGLTKVNTWAGEYVVSAILTILVSTLLTKLKVIPIIAGALTVVCAVVLLLACMGLSKLIKSLIQKSFDRRDDDFRTYGGVGVINRIFGGFTVAIKAVTISLFVLVPVLIVLDFAHISAIESTLAPVYESAFWYALKPVAFDLLILGVINLAIRHGFSKGILTSLWSLFVFALIVGAGFLAYHLVFRTGLFASAASAFAGHLGSLGDKVPFISNYLEIIAKAIIVLGLFLLLLIVILVASFFMTRVIDFARLSNGLYIVDGIFGAIVLLIIAVAVMMFIGYLIQPLYGMEFMQPFDSYFKTGAVANYFYKNNMLIESGVPVLIPIKSWLS